MRKVLQSTLESRLRKWQKKLKLDGWHIKIRYKSCGEDAAAMVFCEPLERTAIINVHPQYYLKEGYRISWDLDSLIVHELLHVEMWEEINKLPQKMREHVKFEAFEEYLCFRYAKIIVDINKRR